MIGCKGTGQTVGQQWNMEPLHSELKRTASESRLRLWVLLANLLTLAISR